MKWDIGEPDDEGGCARLTPFIQGVWRDWDCSKKLPFVCKKYAGEKQTIPAGHVYSLVVVLTYSII